MYGHCGVQFWWCKYGVELCIYHKMEKMLAVSLTIAVGMEGVIFLCSLGYLLGSVAIA